jgi:hypothetical protein
MASSRLTQETTPEKKRKEFKKADREEQRPIKKFKDYNVTPLNAKISEVLMEIKRDSTYRNHKRYQVILLTGMQESIVIFMNKQVITPRGA